MAIVEARSILNNSVPEGLSALRIRQRPTQGPTARLCAVGDIGLSGRAENTAKREGRDRLFAEVSETLKTADIVFGNLECPLAGDIAPGKNFAAPTTGAETLRRAGFNILHLANNHVGEYGQAGLATTLNGVREAGLTPLGAGDNLAAAKQMVRTDISGLRIGWLGCGRTLLPQSELGSRYWEFNEEELLAAVAVARSQVDILIVSIHLGLMYIDYPRPDHKHMAERLMATGVDLILMHHAHVLQGVQITSLGRICCYNLGNFLYDWKEGDVNTPVVLREQNEGAIFLFEVDSVGIASAVALPTWIDDMCCVRWARGDQGERILHRLARISKDLEGDFTKAFERQRAERNTGPTLQVLAFHLRRGSWKYIVASLRRTRLEHFKMLGRWLIGLNRTVP